METKFNENTCGILYHREIQRHSTSHYKLISDRLRRKSELLYKRDLIAHFGCVNAIEFSPDGRYLVSGGDDRRVLLWTVQKALQNCGKPVVMSSEHHSNIFCLSFDNSSTHIYSAGNDDQVILHDIKTGKAVDVFNLQHPIYGISVDPCNDNVFASAGEDGRALIFDTRVESGNEPYKLAHCRSAFHSVMFNPVEPRLIATANSREGCALYDVRVANKVLMQYSRKGSSMNVHWDRTGTRLISLRRRQTPVMFEYDKPNPVVQFYHEKYYNSCTMKSCCFAGLNDEYVLSGSDDFNLYMWKIEDAMKSTDKTNNVHQVLKGHRSIVNHVRFDPYNCIIASSGVEKLIKVWSPVNLPFGTTDPGGWTRARYTQDEYISLLLRSGQFMSHDYSEQSTSEDPQMMAFFDSLVQRERDGLASDSDDSSDDDSICTGIESLEDTDYSSLSDDSAVPRIPTQNSAQTASAERSSGKHRPFHVPRPPSSDNALDEDDEEHLLLCSVTFRSYFDNMNKKSKQDSSTSTSQSQSTSTSYSTSSSSITNASSSSSSSSEEENSNRSPKRKMKSRVKDAMQRLKRVRSDVQSSSILADSASERSIPDTCPNSGGASTDTVDSGVCMNSSPTTPKFKFSSFKRNDKRKYRTRKSSSSSSLSSDSD